MKRKLTKTEFRKAIEPCGGHISALASWFSVTPRTVYRYLEKFSDLLEDVNAAQRESVQGAIEGTGGHIGVIAGRMKVSRQTVYRYLNKFPELKDELSQERVSGKDEIVELAQTGLVQGLLSGDARLIMFALRHYDEQGIPGAVDLGSMFSPDVVAFVEAQGKTMSDVVKEFESIIRMQAEKVE